MLVAAVPLNKRTQKHVCNLRNGWEEMSPNAAKDARQVSTMENQSDSKPLLSRAAHSDLPHAVFPPQASVGQVLGHYRLVEELSHGSMGMVYRAHDEHLEREVALKVLAPARSGDEAARKRFHNEALILSKLNHPNIISVYDFATQNDIDFLVMEYVPGQTLSARLKIGSLAQEEILQIGTQIAAALQQAHDQGVIHRDLKPQNVMLTSGGQVKVADFGLAKVIFPTIDPAATSNVTCGLEIIGTLPYMPPEQLRGEPADFRSDIYSAGAVLYELVTGHRPFPETQGPRLVDSILHENARFPGTLTRLESREFGSIVMKCLEKELARRYQSAAELGVELQHLRTSTALRCENENDRIIRRRPCCFRRYAYRIPARQA
jgi:eukaryotic-like serine/threonine-protein kinase